MSLILKADRLASSIHGLFSRSISQAGRRPERIAFCKERKQPELANAEVMNWAKLLWDEADTGGFELLDTSKISIEESVEYVCERLRIGRSGR